MPMTNKLFFPACFIGAVALAACVSYEPVTPAPQAAVISSAPVYVAPAQQIIVPQGTVQPGAVVVQTQPGVVLQSAPLRPGYATVRSITPLSDGSARLTLAMSDNSIQQVDTRAAVRVGEGVEITMEGYIRYPIPAQAMRNRY
jgi:hypothetical protein